MADHHDSPNITLTLKIKLPAIPTAQGIKRFPHIQNLLANINSDKPAPRQEDMSRETHVALQDLLELVGRHKKVLKLLHET